MQLGWTPTHPSPTICLQIWSSRRCSMMPARPARFKDQPTQPFFVQDERNASKKTLPKSPKFSKYLQIAFRLLESFRLVPSLRISWRSYLFPHRSSWDVPGNFQRSQCRTQDAPGWNYPQHGEWHRNAWKMMSAQRPFLVCLNLFESVCMFGRSFRPAI